MIPRVRNAATRGAPEIVALICLIAFPFVFPLIGGTFDMMDRILIWGLFGLGFDILFGFTGLLAFGQAAFYGTGGFTASYLLVKGIVSNAFVALVAGTVLAAAFGVIIGALSLRRAGIYFAMLTLAFGEMFYFLDISPLSNLTGGENGLSGVPPANLGFGVELRTPEQMYWFIAAIFLLGFMLARSIVRSSLGAILVAIRENAERAAVLGHDVQKYKLTAFTIAAAYGGLAGGLLGLFQGYMPPDAFYLDTSGQLVVQTIMGGAGTLIGPTLGAAVWIYLRTALQQIAGIGALWKMVLGIVFVLIVTLFRKGISGGLGIIWEKFRGEKRIADGEPEPQSASGLPFRHAEISTLGRNRSSLGGPVILEARGVSKCYGGLTAVDTVSFELNEGEIRALIGPNGAGKTTFFNMLAGTIPVSEGDIYFAGDRITGLGSTLICQRGLTKSFQVNQIFSGLSVRNNIRIPALARRYGKFNLSMLRAVADDRELATAVDEAIATVQLKDRADVPANSLAYGEKRRLEIGLALATQPRVLLLDEPTAGMSPGERTDTVQLIRRIAAAVTLVIVEHDMDVVFGLADRITVFFNGRKIAEDTPEAIQADPQVRAAYLGSPIAAHEPA